MSKRTHGEMTNTTPGRFLKTYFDKTCEAALGNIFRYHAHQPRTADWTAEINRVVLIDVSHPHHPLRSAAQGVVKELNLSLGYVGEQAQRTLFHSFGSRSSSLSLKNFWFLPDAWQTCRNLKMLKLECIATKEVVSFRALLAAQSSLEELDLQLASLDMLNAVAENGAGLKRLAISGVDVCVPEPFYHMLKVTGETLLSLKVDRFENFHSYSEESGTSEDIEDHNGTIPFFDIKAIFRFCPHVEELRVYSELGPDCDQLEAVVDLYCSYGKGLKKLDSFVNEGVVEGLMLKIAEHCPNALVRGAHFHQSDPTNLLGILGTRIPWLTIAAGFAHTAPDFPIYLSTRCCNVEHLNIELEYVEAFFLKPKPKLRSLALVLDGPIKVCEANISRVASSTGGLRKLQLHCPPFHRRFWEQIAWRNKDLDTIVVSLAHSYSVNIEAFYIAFMIDIVESLAPCTCLKQITVYTEDYISWKISAVADKCVIFRHRDVGVSLNGVDYLL